jgi:hypothetical protein
MPLEVELVDCEGGRLDRVIRDGTGQMWKEDI